MSDLSIIGLTVAFMYFVIGIVFACSTKPNNDKRHIRFLCFIIIQVAWLPMCIHILRKGKNA